MKKIIVISAFILGALSGHAQEKVMNVLKTDGTCSKMRVADLAQISFLTLDEGGKGLYVKTSGGETTAVLFESKPVVTVSGGKLIVKSEGEEPIEFEIADITEIVFGDESNFIDMTELENFTCILQHDGVLLRGIPVDVKPFVYSMDGRNIQIPPCRDSELRLNRDVLGTGIFIVKVGSFSTKIKL